MIDFAVVGGGIAGVSAAAHLAPHGSVTLFEAEPTLAYHTTGRSAATFVVNYGGQGARPLAKASQSFFEDPPPGSADAPILSDRGLLWIADSRQLGPLRELAAIGQTAGAGSVMLEAEGVLELVPELSPRHVAGGLYEPEAKDIDVAVLHQAFVRIARSHGCEVLTASPVGGLRPVPGGWEVVSGDRTATASVVVNAAGAWGDRVAALAGIEPVGLVPMRRTAFMVPGDLGYASWPMVVDADQRFYFKPDGSQILCSLAEEVPSEPTDPRPRTEDVALAIERINEATNLGIRSVNSQWTGLRTFAPDRSMVIGEEPASPGFFWLVGQGGTGIQTSPAAGALVAAQVVGQPEPPELAAAGVDAATTDPGRFRAGRLSR